MRLGEILIERRHITQEDLDRALELQRERGDKLGKILVDLGFVAQRDVLSALSQQLQVPLVSSKGLPLYRRKSKRFRQISAPVPLPAGRPARSHVTLAMADPLDFETRSTVLLHRADGESGHRIGAGNSGCHRQVITGKPRRAIPNWSTGRRDAKISNICATWPAKRRSSVW